MDKSEFQNILNNSSELEIFKFTYAYMASEQFKQEQIIKTLTEDIKLYDWIPFYQEVIDKLLDINKLLKIRNTKLSNHINPFTFLLGVTLSNKIDSDFNIHNATLSQLSYCLNIKPYNDKFAPRPLIPLMLKLSNNNRASSIINSIKSGNFSRNNLNEIGTSKLSQYSCLLYLINPRDYFYFDNDNITKIFVKNEIKTFLEYIEACKKIKEFFKGQKCYKIYTYLKLIQIKPIFQNLDFVIKLQHCKDISEFVSITDTKDIYDKCFFRNPPDNTRLFDRQLQILRDNKEVINLINSNPNIINNNYDDLISNNKNTKNKSYVTGTSRNTRLLLLLYAMSKVTIDSDSDDDYSDLVDIDIEVKPTITKTNDDNSFTENMVTPKVVSVTNNTNTTTTSIVSTSNVSKPKAIKPYEPTKLNSSELRMLNNRPLQINKQTATGRRYKTEPRLRQQTLIEDDYLCVIDSRHETFDKDNEERYMEVHHLIPMSLQDYDKFQSIQLDRLENMVTLCPTCHRAIHNANSVTKQKYIEKAYKHITSTRQGGSWLIDTITLDELIALYSNQDTTQDTVSNDNTN